MFFAMESLSPPERYRLLVNTVTPRPIAWTVTLDAAGTPNCAPHSFFNVLGHRPPIVALGLMPDPKTMGDKDTARNIKATGEFTIAMVSEADAQAMNLTAIDAPAEIDELALGKIATRPATLVKPPLIASAPATMECRVYQIIETAPGNTIVLGEVLALHIDDAFLSGEGAHVRIDNQAMKLIGRTHGAAAGHYVRNSDSFEIVRPTWPLDAD